MTVHLVQTSSHTGMQKGFLQGIILGQARLAQTASSQSQDDVTRHGHLPACPQQQVRVTPPLLPLPTSTTVSCMLLPTKSVSIDSAMLQYELALMHLVAASMLSHGAGPPACSRSTCTPKPHNTSVSLTFSIKHSSRLCALSQQQWQVHASRCECCYCVIRSYYSRTDDSSKKPWEHKLLQPQ